MTRALGVAIMAVLAGWWAATAVGQKQDDVSQLMRVKLDHAQKVLEGVAIEDFDLIADNARSLKTLSDAAEWKVFQTPEYRLYSAEFRRTAEELAQMAAAKNLDGAALNYVQLTMTCVNCHKHVRNIRLARAE